MVPTTMTVLHAAMRRLTVVENKFCAAEGESGEAASVGLARGLPAFASSNNDKTCRYTYAPVRLQDSTEELNGKNCLPSFVTQPWITIA